MTLQMYGQDRYKQGLEQGVRGSVELLREAGVDDAKIIESIIENISAIAGKS